MKFFGPKSMANLMKYSCEEIHDRMEKGLCPFCEEPDIIGHQLKHKGLKICIVESEENSLPDNETISSAPAFQPQDKSESMLPVSVVVDHKEDRYKNLREKKLNLSLGKTIEHLSCKESQRVCAELWPPLDFSLLKKHQMDSTKLVRSSNNVQLSLSKIILPTSDRDDNEENRLTYLSLVVLIWEPGGMKAKILSNLTHENNRIEGENAKLGSQIDDLNLNRTCGGILSRIFRATPRNIPAESFEFYKVTDAFAADDFIANLRYNDKQFHQLKQTKIMAMEFPASLYEPQNSWGMDASLKEDFYILFIEKIDECPMWLDFDSESSHYMNPTIVEFLNCYNKEDPTRLYKLLEVWLAEFAFPRFRFINVIREFVCFRLIQKVGKQYTKEGYSWLSRHGETLVNGQEKIFSFSEEQKCTIVSNEREYSKRIMKVYKIPLAINSIGNTLIQPTLILLIELWNLIFRNIFNGFVIRRIENGCLVLVSSHDRRPIDPGIASHVSEFGGLEGNGVMWDCVGKYYKGDRMLILKQGLHVDITNVIRVVRCVSLTMSFRKRNDNDMNLRRDISLAEEIKRTVVDVLEKFLETFRRPFCFKNAKLVSSGTLMVARDAVVISVDDNFTSLKKVVQWTERDAGYLMQLVKEKASQSETVYALCLANTCLRDCLNYCRVLKPQSLILFKLLLVQLWPYVRELLELTSKRARQVLFVGLSMQKSRKSLMLSSERNDSMKLHFQHMQVKVREGLSLKKNKNIHLTQEQNKAIIKARCQWKEHPPDKLSLASIGNYICYHP